MRLFRLIIMFVVLERVGLTVVLSPYFLGSSGHLFFVPVMRLYCAPSLAFLGCLNWVNEQFFLFDFVVCVDANAVLVLNQVGIPDSDRCQPFDLIWGGVLSYGRLHRGLVLPSRVAGAGRS